MSGQILRQSSVYSFGQGHVFFVQIGRKLFQICCIRAAQKEQQFKHLYSQQRNVSSCESADNRIQDYVQFFITAQFEIVRLSGGKRDNPVQIDFQFPENVRVEFAERF